MFTRNNDVAVGRDDKIERTEFGIHHQPRRQRTLAGSEDEDGVITLPIRSDAGREVQHPVVSERKPARKRYTVSTKNVLAIESSLTENAMIVRALRNVA